MTRLLLLLPLAAALGACISSDRQQADATADTGAAEVTGDTIVAGDGQIACDPGDLCVDDDPCTDGACVAGFCVQTVVEPCTLCEGDDTSSCVAGTGCEAVSCVDGRCVYQPVVGCEPCDVGADRACDDDDPCTVDACEDGICVHADTCGPLVIEVGGDATLSEGERLVRDGVFVGPAHETVTITVSWGDDSPPQVVDPGPGGTFHLEHDYAADGAYQVEVTVQDTAGRSASGGFGVTVVNVAPIISLEATATAAEGELFEINGLATDPGGDALVATVDYGDGAGGDTLTLAADGTFSLAHRYADDGPFTVTVTVTDDNATTVAELDLDVANVAPTFSVPGVEVAVEGTLTTLTYDVTDPGDDTFSGTVNYGKGTPAVPLTFVDHDTFSLDLLYPDDGSYDVTVVLRDDDGGQTIEVFQVTVTNAPPRLNDLPPTVVDEGSELGLVASFTDPGDDEWTAQVSYGDGDGWQDATVSPDRTIHLDHVYKDEGNFTVVLRVSDNAGAEATGVVDVAVRNVAPTPNAGGDATVAEGTEWIRETHVIDPGDDTHMGTVRWHPAGAAEGLFINPLTGAYTLAHTYAQDGAYAVTVSVVDDGGAATDESLTLTVTNVPPAVDCGGHVALGLGEILSRDCTFTDPGADRWEATVDYGDGDGAVDLAIGADGEMTLSHAYATEGVYRVTVRVDDGRDVGATTFAIAVGNTGPLVDAGADPTLVEGDTLIRTGTVVDGGDSQNFTGFVDYADGGDEEELEIGADGAFTLNHTYASDGRYIVRIRVQDADGKTGTDELTVTVSNGAPVIAPTADLSSSEGSVWSQLVRISDPGGDPLSVEVEFGDGTSTQAMAHQSGQDFKVEHIYVQDGTYTVTITATDDGDAKTVESFKAVVANAAPFLVVGESQSLVEGQTLERALWFDDPGADSWTVTVSWGDGTDDTYDDVTAGTSWSVAHAYTNDGDYTVTVRVEDDDVEVKAGFTVTVTNAAPSVTVANADGALEGERFSHSGHYADLGALDVLSGQVDFGDDSGVQEIALMTNGTFDLTHTWAQDGVYTVTVTITDDGGAEGEGTFTVDVGNVIPVISVGGPASVPEGSHLQRTISFADSGADSWTANVNWDEGAGSEPLDIGADQTMLLDHAFADNGTYDVTVSVADDDATESARLPVTVTNVAPTVNAGGPVTLAEGATLVRDGAVFDPGAADTFTGTVSWGDGSDSEALTVASDRTFRLQHAFAGSGAYIVTVVVTDDDGGTGVDTFQVTISNSAPAVQAGSNATMNEGDTLVRTATFEDEGSGPWTATVDWGDGDPVDTPVDQANKSVELSKQFSDDGLYSIVLTVDDGAQTGQGTFDLTVLNVPPTIDLPATASVLEGEELALNGTFSDPGTEDLHTAIVDYGDGLGAADLPLQGNTFSLLHDYADDGSFTARVSVHDGAATADAAITVNVANVAPSLPDDTSANVPVAQQWQLDVPFEDPGADTWLATITYGDGTTEANVSLADRVVRLDHTYEAAGQYTCSIVVTDDDGGYDSMSIVVTVANVAPTVEAGGARTVAEGSPLTIVASFDDPADDTHTASFLWIGGTPPSPGVVDEAAQTASGTHTYADDASHSVVVTVTDEGGLSGSDVAPVTVTNVAPVVELGSSATTGYDGRLERMGSFTDPGADTWDVSVTWGDGTSDDLQFNESAKTFLLDHTWTAAGDYEVVVTVEDDDGGVGTATLSVTVYALDCSDLGDLTGKKWVGGAGSDSPTDWFSASNWSPLGVPTESTDVLLCAGNTHYPVLTETASAASVALSDSARITTSPTKNLDVRGSLTGGEVVGGGEVVMAGSNVALTTRTPGLRLTGGAVTAGGDLQIDRSLVITSGALYVGAHTVTVGGSATVRFGADGDQVAGLVFDDASSRVDVNGDFTVEPAAGVAFAGAGPLQDGELHVRGDFRQVIQSNSSIFAFVSDGTTVVLDGDSVQRVRFDSPGLDKSRLHDLQIDNAAGVILKSDIAVEGILSLGSTARLTAGGAKTVWLIDTLPVVPTTATYEVARTRVRGDVVMNNDVILPHTTVVAAGGGSVDPDGHLLEVGGLRMVLTPDPTSGLIMDNSQCSVVVDGSSTFLVGGVFDSPAPPPSRLVAGQLTLRGDFTQSASASSTAPPAFFADGMHTVFEAAADGSAHEVKFQGGSGTLQGGSFDTLALASGVALVLESDIRARGRLTAVGGDAAIRGPHHVIAEDVDISGLTLDQSLLTISAATRLENVTFRNQDPTADQLSVFSADIAAEFAGIRFESVPIGGHYLVGKDMDAAGPPFAHVLMVNCMPKYGMPWTKADNGFEIIWGDANADSDGDDLLDGDEFSWGTNPVDPDTDHDSFIDGTEVGLLTLPTEGSERPVWFVDPVELATGSDPSRVALGDLDDSGGPEVLVSNRGADSVSVIFVDQATYTVVDVPLSAGAEPDGVAVRDTNLGGELVVAERGTGQVRRFSVTVDGDVVELGVVETCGNSSASALVTSNFDGLRGDDIAVVCEDDATLVVALKNRPSAVLPWSIDVYAHSLGTSGLFDLAAGDLGDSGLPDIALTGSVASAFDTFWNSAQSPATFSLTTNDTVEAPTGVLIADVTDTQGDELIVADAGSTSLRIFDMTVPPTPPEEVSIAIGSAPQSLATADIDGNGELDLITALPDQDAVRIYFQSVGDAFHRHDLPLLSDAGERWVAAGDLDDDGLADLVVVNGDLDNVSLVFQASPELGAPADSGQ